MKKLSQKRLQHLFEYNKDTGNFIRRTKVNQFNIGDLVGGINKRGYVVITIDGKCYKAHRLAYLYMEGAFPENDVDHINHVKSDNKWDNLRKVTAIENKRNSPQYRTNTSGSMGISWRNDSKRWRARINVEGKCIDLGSFVNFHEAVNSRKNAEAFYGFHINHGK